MIDEYLKEHLSKQELSEMTNEMYISALVMDPSLHCELIESKKKKPAPPQTEEESNQRERKIALFEKLKLFIREAFRKYTSQTVTTLDRLHETRMILHETLFLHEASFLHE